MPDPTAELVKRITSLETQVASLNRRMKADGWTLNAALSAHRFGGGVMMWQFDGQSRQVLGQSDPDNWARTNMDDSNWAAATFGGPYAIFNGTDEYLYHGNQSWQETGAEEFFVWSWCYATSVANAMTIAAKFDTAGGNWRSWRLWYQQGVTEFTFSVSATGLAGSAVDCASTYGAPSTSTWYFVAGYFQPSTLLRIYVGANTDTTLTIDSVVAAVPANTYNGGADLTIGAQGNPSVYWAGRIGQVALRANVPVAYIDEHANMLFHMTRDFYEE